MDERMDPKRDPEREPPVVTDKRRALSEESPSEVSARPGPGAGEFEPDEAAQARIEAEGYLDDLKRLKAEFENYRKRVLKEQTEVVTRASGGLVARLLGVLDNFELAVEAAESTRDLDRMLKGVEMVFGELKEVLNAEGLRAIDAKGRPFDPELHEAALEVPGDELGDLVVEEILRPGYTFKGRVLRPAMVKVSRRRAKPPDASDGP